MVLSGICPVNVRRKGKDYRIIGALEVDEQRIMKEQEEGQEWRSPTFDEDMQYVADGFVIRCLLPSKSFGDFRPESEVEKGLTAKSMRFWKDWVTGMVDEHSVGLMAGQRRDLAASVVRAVETGLRAASSVSRSDMSVERLMRGFVVEPVVRERAKYLYACDLPSPLSEAVRIAVGAFCLGWRGGYYNQGEPIRRTLEGTLKRVGIEKFGGNDGVERIMDLLTGLETGWGAAVVRYRLERIDDQLCRLSGRFGAPMGAGL